MSQFTKWQDFQKPVVSLRSGQLGELRQRVHQRVIEALGPLLDDPGEIGRAHV